MRLQICHLSDIHFIVGENAIEQKKDKLCSAILENAYKNQEILFLVSGDIAQSCDLKQYEIAMEFFIDIQNELQKQKNIKSYFVFAPGNHDAILDPKDRDETNRRNEVLRQKNNLDSEDLDFYQEKMCKKQDNYFMFANSFWDESVMQKINTQTLLMEQYRLRIAEQEIFINILNTSWISQRHERPGEIFIPKTVYEKKIVKKKGLNITMYHHPSNWMHPNDKLEFDNVIRKQSDIIFVGHEHDGREEHIVTREAEFEVEYGEVLQDLDNDDNSAFKIHYVENEIVKTYVYRWDSIQGYYKGEELLTSRLGENINKVISYLPEYREILNSFDMQVTHPKKKNIKLEEIYIFPNIETYNIKKNFDESSREKVTVRGEELLNYILEKRIVEFSGGPKVGKSALAKMISLSLEQRGIHTIIIDLKRINHISLENVKKEEIKAISVAYGKEKSQIYRQLSTDRKLLIFDNIDIIKDKKFKRQMIADFSNYYNCIISFTNMSHELTILEEKIYENEEVKIEQCTIKELGHKQRNRLYKKWYGLNGEENIIIEEELEKKVKKATDIINTLKGNGYMPCIASNIIIILQQLEFQPETKQDKSNYGHMYEFLIHKSILDMQESCEYIKDDIASELLVWVAKYMLENKCKELEEHQFIEIVKAYNDFHLTDASKDTYLREYLRVDLLDDKDDMIMFKYPYIYYYFTAKYLANNISNELVKNTIKYMTNNLQVEEYGDIMIFLCHLSKDSLVFESVLNSSKRILEEHVIFNFNDYKHLKVTFDKYLDTNFRPEEDKEKHQDEMLERQDRYEEELNEEVIETEITSKSEEDEEYDPTELEEKLEKLDAAYKSIEVMGQILKNYPGTIGGEIKIDLLREVHDLGMRSLTYSYEMIKDEMKKMLKKYINRIKKQFHKQNIAIDDVIILKKIQEQSIELKVLTDNLFGFTCFALMRRLSNSVGNEELKILINYKDMPNVLSFQMMRKSVYLNEFGIIQAEKVIAFYEYLKSTKNEFAAKILKLFVYEHYYVFGSKNNKVQQRVWSIFEFDQKERNKMLLKSAENR